MVVAGTLNVVGHTLLHQVLISDLVVPIMLAEAPGHRSLTQFGARPSGDTWLRPDLVVARQDQFRRDEECVLGAPLLVVEVTSPASAARDLGARKDLCARYGVPSYWVVHSEGGDIELHVFELEDGAYTQRARLAKGDSLWITEPFKIELSPDDIFDRLPRTLAADWRGTVPKPPGPDLPPADARIDVDVFCRRWPTGAEKTELENGCPVFYGEWDERDVEIAQRAYPGRTVRLDQPPGQPGTLRVLPGRVNDHTAEAVAEARPLVGFAEAVEAVEVVEVAEAAEAAEVGEPGEVPDQVRKTPVGAVAGSRQIVKIDVPGE